MVDGIIAVGAGCAILLIAIVLSWNTSEHFTDAYTGTMAFSGHGNKFFEIGGALLAVLVGLFIYELLRLRRSPHIHEVQLDAERVSLKLKTQAHDTYAVAWIGLVVGSFVTGSILLSVGFFTLTGLAGTVVPPVLIIVSAVLIVCLSMRAGWRIGGTWRRRMQGAIIAGQVSFAGGATVMIPPPIRTVDGNSILVRNWAGPLAWLLVGGIILIVVLAAYCAWRKLYRNHDAAVAPSRAVVGPAVVVASLALSSTVPVPFVSEDSYHFGELVTPEFLWREFGQVPFVSQLPPRGILVNYIPAWLTQLMATDWVGLLPVGTAVLSLTILSAFFFVAKGWIGAGWASVLTVLSGFIAAAGLAVADLVMVILLLAIARFINWAPPWGTAAVLVLTASASVLLAPGQGLAFVVAALLMVGIRIIQHPPTWLRAVVAGAATFAALLAIIASPARGPILSAVAYVRGQGAINNQVWGIPWALSIAPRELPVQALRSAVLPAVGVIALIVIRALPRFSRASALPLWVGLGGYAAAQLPRALGRIDPEGLSRIGMLTLVVVGIILPITLLTRPCRTPVLTVVGILVTPVLLVAGFLHHDVAALTERALSIPVDAGLTPVISHPGVESFSRALVSQPLLEYATSVSAEYEKLLPAGTPRTLLDLTNAQADFRYLAVGNPLDSAAVFNITSEAGELENLRRLNEQKPEVALLWTARSITGITNDGASLSLRTPLIYDYVMENYTPIECGRPGESYAIWGLRHPSAHTGCRRPSTELERTNLFAKAIGPITDLGLFAPPVSNLGQLPRSWGNTQSSVARVMVGRAKVAPLVRHLRNSTVIQVPLSSVSPRSIFLSLDIDCGDWTSGAISWGATNSSSATSFVFDVGGGRVFVPLGAFPSFVLATDLPSVDITVPVATECRVGEASWLTHGRFEKAREAGLLHP